MTVLLEGFWLRRHQMAFDQWCPACRVLPATLSDLTVLLLEASAFNPP
jgi:hypothetical protein